MTRSVGPGGGVIELNRMRLAVPEGAVLRETAFTMRRLQEADVPDVVFGGVFGVGPGGLALGRPASLSVYVDDLAESNERLGVGHLVAGIWRKVEPSARGPDGRVTGQMSVINETADDGHYGAVIFCDQNPECRTERCESGICQ